MKRQSGTGSAPSKDTYSKTAVSGATKAAPRQFWGPAGNNRYNGTTVDPSSRPRGSATSSAATSEPGIVHKGTVKSDPNPWKR
jgi:hypothetical protein